MTLVRRTLAALALLSLLAAPAFPQAAQPVLSGGNSQRQVVDETNTSIRTARPTFRQLFQQWLARAQAKAASSSVRGPAKRLAR